VSGLAVLGIVVLKVQIFINQACKNRSTFCHQWWQ